MASLALPHPAPISRPSGSDPAAENAKCEACHVEIANEWRGSMHQRAYRDEVFQQAYSLEPFEFCRGCHAPEADSANEPSVAAADVGVSCLTCHVQSGHVVGTASLDRPHAVLGDARMATRAACAACHQFDFPRVPGQPMQNTLSENERSTAAKTECQSCHMEAVAGSDGTKHRSHDFAVLSDPTMLRSAAKITAAMGKSGDLEITLVADRIGHAFPTGDMFRRLEVRATAVDAAGHVLASAKPVHLARTFADQPTPKSADGLYRAEVRDTRVPAPGKGARVAALKIAPSPSATELRWVVAYQRMDHAMAASFGVDPARDEIIVATGVIHLPSP